MRIWQLVKKVIVEIFWPWFKEFAWPLIKKAIEDLVIYIIGIIIEKIKKWTSERAKNNTENANKKADEFDKKAESAKTHEEAEKFRDIAQVWREVAEQFRQENESLKREIDNFSKNTEKEVSTRVDELNIDLDFSHEKPKVSIGDDSYDLPALPSSNDKKYSLAN